MNMIITKLKFVQIFELKVFINRNSLSSLANSRLMCSQSEVVELRSGFTNLSYYRIKSSVFFELYTLRGSLSSHKLYMFKQKYKIAVTIKSSQIPFNYLFPTKKLKKSIHAKFTEGGRGAVLQIACERLKYTGIPK